MLIFILIIFLVIIVLFIMAYKLFINACSKNKNGYKLSNEDINLVNKEKEMYAFFKPWYDSLNKIDEYITSEDGLKLHATYIKSNNPERLVICVPGYRSEASEEFSGILRYLIDNHSSVLLIDNRTMGSSEGEYITFGYMEANDVSKWENYCINELNINIPIFIYGISMGATTALLSTKYMLGTSVKGIIADAGYNNLKSELIYLCNNLFKVPGNLLVNIFNIYAKAIGKFDINDVDLNNVLINNTKNIMFFHGDNDKVVKPENTRTNYAKCVKCNKEIQWFEGAGHANSFYANSELYINKLKYFFDTCENNTFKGE